MARTATHRSLTVVMTLAIAQFKFRYLDSKLSYAWAVARPALLFVVLYGVFTVVAGLDAGVKHYAAYVFLSVVLWSYFADSTGVAARSLVEYGDILRKIPVAPAVIPLSVAFSAFLDLLMSLGAVLVFLVLTGVEPRASWIQLAMLVAVLSVLVAGVALGLSALYVEYRDVDQLWLVGRQVLFYLSPIVYVVAALPDSIEHWALANPVAAVLTQARHAMLDPGAPTAAAAAGGYPFVLVPLAATVAIFVAGAWTFRRRSPRLAERL